MSLAPADKILDELSEVFPVVLDETQFFTSQSFSTSQP